MKHAGTKEIDVYAVGWLWVLLALGRSLRARHPKAIRFALVKVRYEWRCTVRRARAGKWREVRNSLNGYLAEHHAIGSRCGHGWTKRRALRDLHRHLDEFLGRST
jgi:hypothetical protein